MARHSHGSLEDPVGKAHQACSDPNRDGKTDNRYRRGKGCPNRRNPERWSEQKYHQASERTSCDCDEDEQHGDQYAPHCRFEGTYDAQDVAKVDRGCGPIAGFDRKMGCLGDPVEHDDAISPLGARPLVLSGCQLDGATNLAHVALRCEGEKPEFLSRRFARQYARNASLQTLPEPRLGVGVRRSPSWLARTEVVERHGPGTELANDVTAPSGDLQVRCGTSSSASRWCVSYGRGSHHSRLRPTALILRRC